MQELFSLQEKKSTESPMERQQAYVRRFLPYAAAVLLIVAVGGGFLLYSIWTNLQERFRKIDQTSAKVKEEEGATVYENPDYGVVLSLPGKWRKLDPLMPYHFCTMSHPNGLSAAFWPVFPVVGFTPEEYAATIKGKPQSQDGLVFLSEKPLVVNRRPAHELRFSTRHDLELRMVIVSTPFVAYILAITGPAGPSEAWSLIENELEETIQID
jgi:hypothetical protein